MSETEAATATEITTTETTTETETDSTVAEIQALCNELNLSPAQLRGRLEASKKNEQRAKANAKELEELKRQGMSEIEAAVDAARTETEVRVRSEFGGRLATEAVRAAAAGRVADVDALLEGLDASKFLAEDGEPDRDAIGTWIDRLAPPVEETNDTSLVQTLDLAQGNRGTGQFVVDPLEQALTKISRR